MSKSPYWKGGLAEIMTIVGFFSGFAALSVRASGWRGLWLPGFFLLVLGVGWILGIADGIDQLHGHEPERLGL